MRDTLWSLRLNRRLEETISDQDSYKLAKEDLSLLSLHAEPKEGMSKARGIRV